MLAKKLSEQALGVVPKQLVMDLSALHHENEKLGLGSSSAAAAAAAAAVYAHHQRDLEKDESRDDIFKTALKAHREYSPKGSGVDVAASVYGGLRTYNWRDEQIEQKALNTFPLKVRCVWTGTIARTSSFLEGLTSYRSTNPSRYKKRMDELKERATAFIDALNTNIDDAISHAASYSNTMDRLGEEASLPILTQELKRCARIAKDCDGAAKPSGAGGGDLCVAFFRNESSANTFSKRCKHEGLTPIELSIRAKGVHLS